MAKKERGWQNRRRVMTAIGGILILLWGLDLIDKVTNIHGPASQSLWFCSLIVLLLGVGYLARSPMLMVGTLAMMLVVQPVWILDFFGHALGKMSEGMTSYAFVPGFEWWQFLLTLRHLFTIPLAVLGVLMLGQCSRRTYLFIPLFIAALLGVSWLISPADMNLNCIQEPCVESLGFGLEGPIYSIAFFLVTTAMSLVFAAAIDKGLAYLKREKHAARKRRAASILVGALLLLALVGSAYAFVIYDSLPHYTCETDPSCEDCAGKVECVGVRGSAEEPQLLYHISNPSKGGVVCDVSMEEPEKERLATGSYLPRKESAIAGTMLPPITEDTTIKLSYHCAPYE